VTGVQTCALPISGSSAGLPSGLTGSQDIIKGLIYAFIMRVKNGRFRWTMRLFSGIGYDLVSDWKEQKRDGSMYETFSRNMKESRRFGIKTQVS
jgi:hypothetical protein